MVDEHRALLHAGKGAVGPDCHRTQIVVIADAAHHKVLALGGGLRCRRGLAPELVSPFPGLRGGAVIDGHLMAALFDEVSRHRKTHHAETEKSDFRHSCYLGGWPAASKLAGRYLEGGAP